jgi:transketolase
MTSNLYPGATAFEDAAIRQIVAVAMDAPAAAKSGHSGTAMALAPLGVLLFSRVLKHDPTDPTFFDRDRFILSCGHASILQYGLANAFGYDVTAEDLRNFRQPFSRTPGHPENGVTPTVEVTTGPLGQGVANGVGMAIAERLLRAQHGAELVDHRTYVIAGDGCLEEGISHEAASLAGALGLDRLTVFYDDNHITIDGPTELALRDDAVSRFTSYGWQVINVGDSANDLDVLQAAIAQAHAETSKPTLIVVRSHIGFPSPAMMDRREAHGSPFSAAAIAEVKEILGVSPEPFTIDDALPASFVAGAPRYGAQWRERVAAAGERGAALEAQIVSGGALVGDATAVRYDEGAAVATRKAMQRAMDSFAGATLGLTSGSADLTDNTGVVVPATTAQGAQSPEGRQIYYGIREFAMGAVMVGQALHGGVRPVGSTFFVFSDYVRPAIRLAALSHANTLFVFTHDSVGVGEDGPTHQPVEHLMALRAMPNLHVVRPSDANETLSLVESYLRDPHPGATALVLTRQDIPVLAGDDAVASTQNAHRGGYVVREADDAVFTLFATGSEVSVCLRAADELRAQGLVVRVVALPCWTCFEAQDDDYKAAVLRYDVPSVSLEAGSTLGWHKYADEALGIDTFGLSAPGPFVYDHFAMTASAVVDHVTTRLEMA